MRAREMLARSRTRLLIRVIRVIGALVLLPAVLSAPWSRDFGECILTGDSDGAPLARSGQCATAAGLLELSHKGITSLQNNPFDGMGACTRVFLQINAISDVPLGTFDSLVSLT